MRPGKLIKNHIIIKYGLNKIEYEAHFKFNKNTHYISQYNLPNI